MKRMIQRFQLILNAVNGKKILICQEYEGCAMSRNCQKVDIFR